MRLRLGISERIPLEDMKDALDAALEASTASQTPLIATGHLPTFGKALRHGRVEWRPEPPGDEHFDGASTVLKRGWGDCDDLAPWHAASLRASGADKRARAVAKRSGPHKWHAVVKRGDGSIEDPSAAAGMYDFKRRHGISGADMVDGVDAPMWPSMFGPRAGVAVLPEHLWTARTDVPDLAYPWAWSNVSYGRTPAQAARKSIVGALGFTERADAEIDEADYARLAGLADLLSGATEDEVAEAFDEIYGEESVGFLPALLPAAASLAAPLVSKILPGGKKKKTAPAAAPPPGGGGGYGGGGGPPGGGGAFGPSHVTPGTTMMMPGGTTIVRF